MENLAISFSGGRTSAYMARQLQLNPLANNQYFVFMNTGAEDERTLDFVDRCDREWGLDLVWLEADVRHGERVGTKYKVVSYETASRDCEPFYEVVKKYGIPNKSYPHCKRELKIQPFNSWLADTCPDAYRAVGIRCDEIDRMAANADEMRIIYPLITRFPARKGDVLGWWSRQDFDLDLPEHYGNCVTCWKKSDRKLLTLANDDPALFDHFNNMEIIARDGGFNATNNKGNFFRKNRSTQQILEEAKSVFDRFNDKYYESISDNANGCAESCDLFS